MPETWLWAVPTGASSQGYREGWWGCACSLGWEIGDRPLAHPYWGLWRWWCQICACAPHQHPCVVPLQVTGLPYLHGVLGPTINRVFEEKKHVELDPGKVEAKDVG